MLGRLAGVHLTMQEGRRIESIVITIPHAATKAVRQMLNYSSLWLDTPL